MGMEPSSVLLLCSLLTPDLDVLEWGSGGSTLFFSQYVRSWHSIEHDRTWARRVRNHLRVQQRRGEHNVSRVRLDLVKVDLLRGEDDRHAPLTESGKYMPYIGQPMCHSYDLILIDGLARF